MDGERADRTVGAGAAPGGRRIPAQAWEARQAAQALLAEAQEGARRILAEAERDVSVARAAAIREGHAEGLARAAAELLRAADERDRLLASGTEEVIQLAAEMAARILAREVRPGDDAVRAARRALDELRAVRRVTLRASPSDAAAIREKGSWQEGTGPGVSVLADPALGRGEVVVEADGAVVDGRFPAQLEELRRAIAGACGPGR